MTCFNAKLRACAAACLLAAALPSLADTDPLAALQAAYARAVTPGEQADRHRELIATLLQRVERHYAREVDLAGLAAAGTKVLAALPPGQGEPAEVFKTAINESLATLDRYTRYRDARTWSQERSDSSGSFGGLGLEVEPGDGVVRVVAPAPDSPAARAGLKPGDLIVRVDDRPLQGVPLAEAIARMRGEPGTPVSVTIRRAGREDEFTVSLTRDVIRRQALRWSMEEDVLVLKLSTFTAPVTAALAQAVAQATAAHQPQAVVLDLRGNGGGLLREAVSTADSFLRQGEIVSLRSRSGATSRSWQADAAELLPGLPMVVLVDRRSASASELVAAALQENGRAKVMGQRSFGKGTVQTTYGLGEGQGAIKLTTSYYISPSGRSVQDAGVPPDIELLPSAPTDAPPAGSPLRIVQTLCPTASLGSDPALACAVAWLRSGGADAFATATADFLP